MTWNVFQNLHKDLVHKFASLVGSNSLPSVLMLEGRFGIGKVELAERIACLLLCDFKTGCGTCGGCLEVITRKHSDYLYLGDQTGSLGVETADLVSDHMSLMAGNGKARVLLIGNVERCSAVLVNKLLKNFEEPAPGHHIILTTSRSDSVLDTLKSRCVKWPVQPPGMEDFKNAVLSVVSTEDADKIEELGWERFARLSGYSPRRSARVLEAGLDLFANLLLPDCNVHSQGLEKLLEQISKLDMPLSELMDMVEIFLNERLKRPESSLVPPSDIHKRRRLLTSLRRSLNVSDTRFNKDFIFEALRTY